MRSSCIGDRGPPRQDSPTSLGGLCSAEKPPLCSKRRGCDGGALHGAGFRDPVGGRAGTVPACGVPVPRSGARCFGRGLWLNWKSRATAEGQGEGVGLAPSEGAGECCGSVFEGTHGAIWENWYGRKLCLRQTSKVCEGLLLAPPSSCWPPRWASDGPGPSLPWGTSCFRPTPMLLSFSPSRD